MIPVTIIIHTLNEEINLPYALENVTNWASQVCVVDSESNDKTCEIAQKYKADLYSRACDRKGLVNQRNWALDNINFKNEWVFILDADELMDDELKLEIENILISPPPNIDRYICRFKLFFLGKWIPKSHLYPTWNIRFFKHKNIRYEKRECNANPNQNQLKTNELKGHINAIDRKEFSAYIKRIDEFSTLEAIARYKLITNKSEELKSNLFESRASRRRYLKNIFVKLPFRAPIMFVYLFFFRLGFLEGKEGFYYILIKVFAEWATSRKIEEIKKVKPFHNIH